MVGGMIPVMQRLDREDGLDAAGRAEQVTGHRLGRTDHGLVGVVAERALHRQRFGKVAERRRRAVRVEVIDLVGVDAGIAEGHRHAARRAFAVLAGRGHVECIG
jgi:hypothetical protein